MRIQYVVTGSTREVDEGIGRRLIRIGVAIPADAPPPKPAPPVVSAHVEISAATGKPKRKYQRRDMRADPNG